MILSLIVVAVCVTSVAGSTLVAANQAAVDATREATKRHGIAGTPLGCFIVVAYVILVGLWTWYAFDQWDWRFAAVGWVPVVCTMLGRMARSKQPGAVRRTIRDAV